MTPGETLGSTLVTHDRMLLTPRGQWLAGDDSQLPLAWLLDAHPGSTG